MPYRIRRLLLGAAGILLSACSSDGTPFSPTVENVAGSYHATTLSVTEANVTTNFLALGASLTLTLHEDGTTSGRLLVPGAGEGGGDFDVDLTGTWTLSDSTIMFDQPGDTFIRDMPFTADRNRITGEATFDGATIRVVLSK
jgi:hypothetical protein